uniref:Uncharacterized protein ycf20 n=1 Tax=Hildenbrandia rubra TaxID=31481 RepID=A0A1C9CFY3_9FLOR|nr:hypothetical protein Hrub_066 [Hildenbrandia rubra]AOM67310.1 hypothetical protein Hrub_066 [Hildenbrandia rubra]
MIMLKNYFIKDSSFGQQCNKLKTILVIKRLTQRIISLLLGFFLATVLSTLPGQTGDWTIIGASIIVSFTEYLSQCIYSNNYIQFINSKYCFIITDLKIGITYGLFVDSFKLGS